MLQVSVPALQAHLDTAGEAVDNPPAFLRRVGMAQLAAVMAAFTSGMFCGFSPYTLMRYHTDKNLGGRVR